MLYIQNVFKLLRAWMLALCGVAMLICSCEETDDLSGLMELTSSKQDSLSFALKVPSFQFESKASNATSLLVSASAWRVSDVTNIPEWLTITPTRGTGNAEIFIQAEENVSEASRKATILFVNDALSDVATLTVSQTGKGGKENVFMLKESFFYIKHQEFNATSLLVSSSAWRVSDADNIPEWLTITPTSGTGNAEIFVHADENMFSDYRKATINFVDEALHEVVPLIVIQMANPNGMEDDNMFLGFGYDASGRYAEEVSLKAPVLDAGCLVLGNHVAGMISPNTTVEEVVTGKTLSEYEENISLNVGIEGEMAGFSSSVKFNFSEKALGTQEYSFATLRHMTKKRIYRIYENLAAEDLMDCLSDMFVEDVEKAAAAKSDATQFAKAVKGLLDKYGTHVVSGFSLGGVLEYSMAADASSFEGSVDWGLAVEAGFEEEGVGKISSSNSSQAFSRIKNESSGFESKLICRGGESQYVSSGYGENAGKTAETYGDWLTSLEEEGSWVMVDFEGSNLIPLWDFIEDEQVKSALYEQAKLRLQGLSKSQTSDYKMLEIKLVSIWANQDDAGDESEWKFKIESVVDKQSSTMKRNIINRTEVLEIPENQEYSVEYLNATSGEYKLAKSKAHTVAIQLTDCGEEDPADTDKADDVTLELTYSATEGWSYMGTEYGSEKNQTIRLGDNGTIRLYSHVDDGSIICFTFQLTWK